MGRGGGRGAGRGGGDGGEDLLHQRPCSSDCHHLSLLAPVQRTRHSSHSRTGGRGVLEQAGREKGGGNWAPEGAAIPQALPSIAGLDGIRQGAWHKRGSLAGPEDKIMLRLSPGSAHLHATSPGVAQKLVRATQAPGIITLTPLPSSVPMIPAPGLQTCLGHLWGRNCPRATCSTCPRA